MWTNTNNKQTWVRQKMAIRKDDYFLTTTNKPFQIFSSEKKSWNSIKSFLVWVFISLGNRPCIARATRYFHPNIRINMIHVNAYMYMYVELRIANNDRLTFTAFLFRPMSSERVSYNSRLCNVHDAWSWKREQIWWQNDAVI